MSAWFQKVPDNSMGLKRDVKGKSGAGSDRRVQGGTDPPISEYGAH